MKASAESAPSSGADHGSMAMAHDVLPTRPASTPLSVATAWRIDEEKCDKRKR